jgi:hypothetical protein
MGLAIGVLLTIGALTVIAWPFLRRRSGAPAGVGPFGEAGAPHPQSLELRRARGEIYRQVRQLEADHSAGLVGQAEFQSQMSELRGSAAALLREEANLPGADAAADGGPDPMARLEREIANVRASLGPSGDRPRK